MVGAIAIPLINLAFLNLTHWPAAWLRPPEAASSQGTVLAASAEGVMAKSPTKARVTNAKTTTTALRLRGTA